VKNLLRMSLLIIARAGLCLAVVAWVVGQWTCVRVGAGTPAGSAQIMTSHLGLYGQLGLSPNRYRAGIRYYERTRWDEWFEHGPSHWSVYESSVGMATFPGIGVSIRHWLVVSFFALFYGVLKLVCRERGKAVADE
jgi:hypothetical protein